MISNNEFDDWGQSPAASENPDARTSGVDLMQVAARRKGLIALGIFIGLCLGLLYYARATPKFETVAMLSIVDKAPPMATAGRMEEAFAMTTPAEDHAIRIKSARMIKDALELDKGALKKLPSLVSQENMVEVIYDGLTVRPVQDGSEVLTLSYRGTNAEDCGEILDAIMRAYTKFLNIGRENIASEMKNWITEARDRFKTDLELKNDQHEQWKLKVKWYLNDNEGLNLHGKTIASIKQLLFEEELRRDELVFQLETIEQGAKEGMDPGALLLFAKAGFDARQSLDQSIMLERIRHELAIQSRDVERDIPYKLLDKELETRFGKDHPSRKSIQEKIKEIEQRRQEHASQSGGFEITDEKQRAKEQLAKHFDSLKLQLKDVEDRIRRLKIEFDRESDEAEKIAKNAAIFRSQSADIKHTADSLEAVVKQFHDVNLLDAYGGDNNIVIEPLQDPGLGVRVEPNLAKSLGAGTILGFLAGFGLGYLVEMFDKTFRNPQEVSNTLQLPMIGHIPEIKIEAAEGSALSNVLVAAHKPKSPLAENFRAIRTALYFSTAGQQNRVIQTTSPVPGDGKSTLTANLAITIAQSNKSVLLMDADFRRPTLHKLMGVENTLGLASVVAGEVEPADCIKTTEIPNLYLMTCGPRPHNPSELLTSPNFASLIESLREQYDFILIDTPPVLAVTDPGIVSARVDGVMMALRIRKNGRPSAVRARKILHDLDANVLGIVVNGIDHRSGSYGYYSSYRRGYGYNYGYNYGSYGDSTEQAINKYFDEPGREEANGESKKNENLETRI